MLSCLKVFNFPQWPPRSSYGSDGWGENDIDQSEVTSKWPDSLETFYIPCSLDTGWILAFEKVPASLTSLIIKDGLNVDSEALDMVFDLIGPQILTLKVEYIEEPEKSAAQLASIFSKFPNLLHLSVRTCFIYDQAMGHTVFETDHPLRSITIRLDQLDDICDTDLIERLNNLLDYEWLPSVRRVLLSTNYSLDRWLSFLREVPTPLMDVDFLYISTRLKRRSSSACGPQGSGVWLVDSADGNSTICEFTGEMLPTVFMCGSPI
jgi:hypothetical protein